MKRKLRVVCSLYGKDKYHKMDCYEKPNPISAEKAMASLNEQTKNPLIPAWVGCYPWRIQYQDLPEWRDVNE